RRRRGGPATGGSRGSGGGRRGRSAGQGESERWCSCAFSERDGETEVAADLASEVHDELAVVGGHLEVVPGQGPGRGTGHIAAVARVLRAVARAEEAVGQAHGLALDLLGLGLREGFGATG